jgi:hypothetical protein
VHDGRCFVLAHRFVCQINRQRIPMQVRSLRPRHAPHTSVGSHSVHPSVVSYSLLITSVLLLISMPSHTQADRHHTSYNHKSLTERALHFCHTPTLIGSHHLTAPLTVSHTCTSSHRSTHRVSHMYIISPLHSPCLTHVHHLTAQPVLLLHSCHTSRIHLHSHSNASARTHLRRTLGGWCCCPSR